MAERYSIRWVRRVLVDALTLNPAFYEHSHRSAIALPLAQGIVGSAALSYGLGSGLVLLLSQPSPVQWGVGTLINGLSLVAGYYLWTYAIWLLDTYLAPPVPPYRELLIPVGFAYAPQVLNLLGVIPLFGPAIALGLAGWTLLGAIAAVRAGLNISLAKAVLLASVGFIPVQIALGLIQATVQTWIGG